MSTTKLKPLLLPQLVEERRKRESFLSDSEMDLSSSYYTQNSSASELPSPITPTLSTRGHFRYPSSTSSADSAYHPSNGESPASPTFVAAKGKRSLPDVQEEPHEREEEEEFDMFDDELDGLYNCLCDSQNCLHRDSLAHSSVQLSTGRGFDYDIADGFFSDGEFSVSPRSKKRRANETALNGLATRFGTRFPSFSRKFRLRKGASSTSLSDAMPENTTSGATSSRSSSISNSVPRDADISFEAQLPPTPTRSVYGREDLAAPIDIERANRDTSEHEEGLATTPLLPPLMVDTSANKPASMQSPLQSPSVAEVKDPFAGNITPIDAIATPQTPFAPSPPLSTKPSISSFHLPRPGHLISSSDIPPILIASPDDEWAIKLGHANYTVYPEPYLPCVFDLEACRQLRTDWDLARTNYTKHLVRTGEHYGATSKTYKFTEEKWSAIDAIWRKNNDLTVLKTSESGDAFKTLKHTTLGDPGASNIMTKIPSLNDPRSEGKFPKLGDGEIVGPMQVAVAVTGGLKRSPSKKDKIFRFMKEKFPSALGKP